MMDRSTVASWRVGFGRLEKPFVGVDVACFRHGCAERGQYCCSNKLKGLDQTVTLTDKKLISQLSVLHHQTQEQFHPRGHRTVEIVSYLAHHDANL